MQPSRQRHRRRTYIVTVELNPKHERPSWRSRQEFIAHADTPERAYKQVRSTIHYRPMNLVKVRSLSQLRSKNPKAYDFLEEYE